MTLIFTAPPAQCYASHTLRGPAHAVSALQRTELSRVVGTNLKGRRRCGGPLCCAAQPNQVSLAEPVVDAVATDKEEATASTSAPEAHGVHSASHEGSEAPKSHWKRTAYLRSSKSHTIPIQEQGRPLAEYMALPASQYSVLDAKRIERIDDSTFRCYVGGLRFFGLVIEPVLTVSVIVGDRGPTVKLLATELEGSPSVVAANDRFEATMINVVRWDGGPNPESPEKELRSDTSIQVALEVPGWMRAIPVGAIERTGSSVMQKVLNQMLPKFLSQLQVDYQKWASGDESRKPVGTGEL